MTLYRAAQKCVVCEGPIQPNIIGETLADHVLGHAYQIRDGLLEETADLFTLGEILWLSADVARLRFVSDKQGLEFLEQMKALRDRVASRRHGKKDR